MDDYPLLVIELYLNVSSVVAWRIVGRRQRSVRNIPPNAKRKNGPIAKKKTFNFISDVVLE